MLHDMKERKKNSCQRLTEELSSALHKAQVFCCILYRGYQQIILIKFTNINLLISTFICIFLLIPFSFLFFQIA